MGAIEKLGFIRALTAAAMRSVKISMSTTALPGPLAGYNALEMSGLQK